MKRKLLLILLVASLFSCKNKQYLVPESPFIKAIEADNHEEVKRLVSSGDFRVEATLNGYSPACRAKTKAMLDTLVELGFDLTWDENNRKESSPSLPFIIALLNGHNHDALPEVLQQAIALGQPVNFQERLNGYTPAMLLIRLGNSSKVEKMKILKNNGADFSLKDKKGMTVLATAKKKEKKSLAEVIAYLESIGAPE